MRLLVKPRIPFKAMILGGFFPSSIKKFILRMGGAKIGNNVKIGIGSIIISQNILIEDDVKISPFTFIIAEKLNIGSKVIIGSFSYFDLVNLKIDAGSRIRESVHVGGNRSQNSILAVGSKCLILQNVVLNTTDAIKIGNNTAIGGGSKLFTHSSWLSILEGYPVVQGPINIGNNVWIPYDTTILANVSIGDDTIITPRTVINKNIPSKSIAGGYPLLIRKNFYKRELSGDSKLKIFKSIINDLRELILFDGFKIDYEDETSIILSNHGEKIFLTLSIPFNLLKNLKRATGLVLGDFEIDINKVDKHISIVYLKDKKPQMIHPNKQTELLLTFLSRYGIR